MTSQSFQSPTLCDPMDCSMAGFPVHQLPEPTQTHVYQVGDAIQPSHPLLSPSPKVCSDSCSMNWWCHSTILSSIIPFSSCLQSFPSSGSFPLSQLFTLGGQSIGVSASTSVLAMNIQDWFPIGLTALISLQSKGLWRVFSNTTVQKHEFFSAQLSL